MTEVSLEPAQFQAFMIALAMIVFLLAVLAVGKMGDK